MSRSINRATIMGRLGNEPEIRTTQSGTKVARLSIATSRKWKDRSGGEQESTQWHRVTLWDRLADIAEQYLHKGDRVYVEGRIEYSETEHEGQRRFWTDIVVQEMVMLGGEQRRETAAQSAPVPSPFDDDGSDLPF